MNSALNVVVDVQAVLDRLEDYSLPPEQYLNKQFGRGNWRFDPLCNCFIAPNEAHRGPGKGFVIVERDLRSTPVTVSRLEIH